MNLLGGKYILKKDLKTMDTYFQTYPWQKLLLTLKNNSNDMIQVYLLL